MITCTHTYTVLTVSREAYAEIERLLREAQYDHVFHQHHEHGTVIDMHGMALARPEPDTLYGVGVVVDS